MDPEEQDGALNALTSGAMQDYAVPQEAPPADDASTGGLTMAEYLRREDEDKAAREAELATRKQNFDAYTQALREARTGPTKEERIIQALYAFGAPVPKQGGNFFTALSNAGKSLQATRQEASDAEAAMKLKMAELGLQESSAVGALNEKYRTAGAANRRALTMQAAKQYKVMMSSTTGEMLWAEGPNIGKPVTGAAAQDQTTPSAPPDVVTKNGRQFYQDRKGNWTPLSEARLSDDDLASRAADVEEARGTAKTMVAAKAALPGAIASANIAIKGIDELLNHPGKSAVIGVPNPLKGGFGKFEVPGSPAANFRVRLNQLKGSAFLSAYDALRGGGSITEVEGKKAEEAKARLDTAQNEEEFDAALADFKSAVLRGVENLRKASVAAYVPPSRRAAAAPAASATQTKIVKGVTYYNDTGAKDGWYTKK